MDKTIFIEIPEDVAFEMGENVHCPKCGEFPISTEEQPTDNSYDCICKCGIKFNVNVIPND